MQLKKSSTPEPLELSLSDTEWPPDYIDHDRMIVRAIVFDDEGKLYFAKIRRKDIFADATLIETAGGGVEKNETLIDAIERELLEELGASVEIVCPLGVVSDDYNLIHRHNINHYFLCKLQALGETHRTKEEIRDFHMSTWKLDFEDACHAYESGKACKLGRLLANRELPILHHAKVILERMKETRGD